MIILIIQFVALAAICYMFVVYATRGLVYENKGKLLRRRVVKLTGLLLLVFFIFASWYVRLGLAS